MLGPVSVYRVSRQESVDQMMMEMIYLDLQRLL